MPDSPCSSITLRALTGEPLRDEAVKQTVVSAAHAICERQGIVVSSIDTGPDRITVTLDAGRIEAVGFVAELRRLTDNWYRSKYGGGTLWGEPPREEDDGRAG